MSPGEVAAILFGIFALLIVLRVPVAPHYALIYGSALHKAVQEFHRLEARGQVMTEAQLFEAFSRAWSNDGFLLQVLDPTRMLPGGLRLRRQYWSVSKHRWEMSKNF